MAHAGSGKIFYNAAGRKGSGMDININTIGTAFVVMTALVFYVRIMMLQQNKSRQRMAAFVNGRQEKSAKQNKAKKEVVSGGVRVIHWGWMLAAIVLILLGAALAGLSNLPQNIKDFWWLPVSAGIIMMTFNFK